MNTGQLTGHRIVLGFVVREGELRGFREDSVLKPGDRDHLLPTPPDAT